MNVSVSLEGDSTGPVTPPSTDTCYKAEIYLNKTMFEMYYDRGIEYSPLYAIVANATSTEVQKQFNVTDVSTLFEQMEPSCPIDSVALFEKSSTSATDLVAWSFTDVLSWSATAAQGTFDTSRVFDTRYVTIVVANKGGFRAEATLAVTVAPEGSTPPGGNETHTNGTCTPADVFVNWELLKQQGDAIQLHEVVNTTVDFKTSNITDLL